MKNEFIYLDEMIRDMSKAKDIYRPGKYWFERAERSSKIIKSEGISKFRSNNSLIGRSFSDSFVLDSRIYDQRKFSLYNIVNRCVSSVSSKFNNQVRYTKRHFDAKNDMINKYLESSDQVKTLLRNYVIPQNSTSFGCESFKPGAENTAHLYFTLLHRHSILDKGGINFGSHRSIMEIGGGFGVNIHLLLSNYPNIRKVVYLDIPPTLYVGSEYLKSIFGSSVKTYSELRNRNGNISFLDNDDLEILCIAPWQIEDLDLDIDYFTNANSFTEMPLEVVKNYVEHIKKYLKQSGQVGLVSYTGNEGITIPSFEIAELFDMKYSHVQESRMIEPGYTEDYFIING
jgi:putative sugar O-methyltransferase